MSWFGMGTSRWRAYTLTLTQQFTTDPLLRVATILFLLFNLEFYFLCLLSGLPLLILIRLSTHLFEGAASLLLP